MKSSAPDGPVTEEVTSVLETQGFSLVELSVQKVKKRTHVHCVIYHRDGFDLEKLSEIHRLIEPRLELLLDERDMYIEFSSPGISRKLKSFHEFALFTGISVTVVTSDGASVEGTISTATDDSVTVTEKDGKTNAFTSEQVVSARLIN